MTDPRPRTMLLPTVSVWSDGDWVADGRDSDTDDTPQALTGLQVTWGRSTVVDQPQPATCTLTLMDRAGGTRFTDMIRVGGRLDVTTDAVLVGPPAQPRLVIDEGFETGTGNAYLGSGTGTLTSVPGGTTGAKALQLDTGGVLPVVVHVPPAPMQPVNGDPTAWDEVPRSLPNETWSASVDVRLPDAFAGYAGWAVTASFLSYGSPWATPAVLADLTSSSPVSGGWVRLSGTLTPPPGVWLGVRLSFTPTGPAWDDLAADAVTTRTNRATNPRAVASGAQGWDAGSWGTGGAGTTSWASGVFGPPGSGITTCRRKTWTTGTTANTPAAQTGFAAYASATEYFPCTAGQVLTASVWYRYTPAAAAVPKNLQLWIYQVDRLSRTGAVAIPTFPSVVVPVSTPGQWQRVELTWTVAAGALGYRVTTDIGSGGTSQQWAAGDQLEVTGLLVEAAAAPAGAYFDGDSGGGAGWSGPPNASTSVLALTGVPWDSVAAAVSWDSLGRLLADRVQLTAPAAGTLRTGMVFSGRVTDLEASNDTGTTYVDVTAADQRAELGNRDVGDQPWGAEPLGSRFARIVAASGQPIESRVSSTAAAYQVSWRDVDRQPAMVLLSELATTADGVLWAATHPVTGPFLLLESLADRQALFELTEQDGMVIIVLRPVAAAGALVIDACDILLDPVRWRQDIEDMGTRVALTWREQTLDDKGQPAPTDRTVTVTNPALEADIGVHRIAVSTQLTGQTDAQVIADAILGRTGNTAWRVSGLTWRADTTDQLDPDELNGMMRLLDGTARNGLPIILDNLPDWSPVPGTQVPLYLEGGQYEHRDGGWALSLVVSAATATGMAAAWDELDPSWAWDQFDPDISWADLSGVLA